MANPGEPGYLSKKDADQVLRAAWDENTNRLRTDAQITGTIEVHLDAANDSVAIGDGTDEMVVNPDGSINTNIVGEVAIEISAADGDNVAINDGTNTMSVESDGSINANVSGSVSVWNFPATQPVTGPLTNSELRASPVPVSGTITVTPSGTQDVNIVSTITVPVSAAALPLPTGAATAALQTQPGVDIGDVTVNNAAGAAAVNIQDGGNSITIDGTVAATQSGTWNINNISGTVSLPTGAATSALQTTGNTSLSSIDTKTPSLGQATMAASSPVVIASNQTAVPISASSLPLPTGAATAALQTQPGVDIGDVTVNNAAGASAVNIQDGGNSITVDGTVAATQSGTWNITNISGTVSLPTGAATAANQATEIASLASIDAGIPAALGQTTMSASMPVTLASNQSALPITDNSGSLTVDNAGTFAVQAAQSGTWNITNISGTVSLPTGAATAALQTQPGVDIGDVTINNASGASAVNIQDGGNSITVDGTITANQGGAPWSSNETQIGGVAISTGNGVAGTGVQRVTIASDNTAFTVNAAPIQGTLTDRSITATNVSQTLMAANSNRRYILIQNTASAGIWINFTTAATAASPSIYIDGGSTFTMEGSFVSTEAINVIRASSNVAVIAKEG